MSSELHTGDRVIVATDPKDDWIVASIDQEQGTAQLARFDLRRVVKLSEIKLARTHNRPIDTPYRRRDVREY